MNKKIDILIIIINIFFFLYYAVQLLVFTDEFARANLGFYNHAVAGLSEIIGIIFVTFSIGCLLYTSPSPRDKTVSRMPSSA